MVHKRSAKRSVYVIDFSKDTFEKAFSACICQRKVSLKVFEPEVHDTDFSYGDVLMKSFGTIIIFVPIGDTENDIIEFYESWAYSFAYEYYQKGRFALRTGREWKTITFEEVYTDQDREDREEGVSDNVAWKAPLGTEEDGDDYRELENTNLEFEDSVLRLYTYPDMPSNTQTDWYPPGWGDDLDWNDIVG